MTICTERGTFWNLFSVQELSGQLVVCGGLMVISLWNLISFVFEACILRLFRLVTFHILNSSANDSSTLISANESEWEGDGIDSVMNENMMQLYWVMWKGLYLAMAASHVREYTMSKLYEICFFMWINTSVKDFSLNCVIFIRQVDLGGGSACNENRYFSSVRAIYFCQSIYVIPAGSRDYKFLNPGSRDWEKGSGIAIPARRLSTERGKWNTSSHKGWLVGWFGWLVFNDTFSSKRLYRAMRK